MRITKVIAKLEMATDTGVVLTTVFEAKDLGTLRMQIESFVLATKNGTEFPANLADNVRSTGIRA